MESGPQAPPPPAEPPGGWQQPVEQAQPSWVGAPLASWGSRVAAAVIDWLILLVPIAVVVGLILLAAQSGGVEAAIIGLISGLVYLAAVVAYAPVLMMRKGEHNGQTWGKQIIGITVVRDNGVPFGFGYAFLREFVVEGLLFGTVGAFFFYIPTLLDYLWPLWDDQNRCLHDMVVSTHVVRV